MHPGVIGGIIGAVIGGIGGLVGGIIGTYFSVKNTNGPRERAFMIKSVVVCWITLFLFLGFLFFLPTPYKAIIWLPYGIFLPFGIVYINKKQQEIKRKESQDS